MYQEKDEDLKKDERDYEKEQVNETVALSFTTAFINSIQDQRNLSVDKIKK